MNIASKIAAGIPALLLVLLGFAWWVAPDFVTAQLGMTLQRGAGLSTQIGDLASFFITLGACVLIALMSGNRLWFYPAIMLLTFAIVGRWIAWLFHGAELTVGIIAVETALVGLLLLVSASFKQRR
ncbi:MAG: hypothetical protein AAFY84_11480 [Pseudomonadota bacterium]